MTVMANHRTDELRSAAHVVGRAAAELGVGLEDTGRLGAQLPRAA
jgi:hypothetical protein